ncbi:MAG: protein BatD [Saprospiraceae bacterium]|nr:protein BatD [Saprospiraceae bacterium]
MQRIYILLFVLLSPPVWSQGFVVETDAKTVLQGSSFRVTFKLYNAEGSAFQPPDFSPFQVIAGPSRSMHTSIVNGQRSSSQGYVYELLGQKVGKFKIPPASIRVQGQEYRTGELWIEVVKANENQASNQDIFIVASLDKSSVFVGEQCQLTYKLYTRVAIENIEAASRPNLDAFYEMAVNMLNNPVQREVYKGQEYMTKVLSKTALFPIKSGNIAIDPVVYRLVRGDNDPFGFGMPSFFRKQIENVSCNSLELEVLSLPAYSSSSFSGAVGEMGMKADPPGHRFSLNDAIHVHVQIRGNGHFKGLTENMIVVDSAFEVTDVKKGNPLKITDEPEIIQSQDFDFLLVPKMAGTFTIRPEFVYFDTQKQQYQSIKDSFEILIVGQTENTGIASTGSKEPGLMELPDFYWKYKPLHQNIFAYLLFLFPLATFGFLKYRIYKTNARQKTVSSALGPDANQHPLEKEFMVKALLHLQISSGSASVFQVKNLLSQQTNDPKSIALLGWLASYEKMKYSGQLNAQLVDELRVQLKSM